MTTHYKESVNGKFAVILNRFLSFLNFDFDKIDYDLDIFDSLLLLGAVEVAKHIAVAYFRDLLG
jgi:hypothetical protein